MKRQTVAPWALFLLASSLVASLTGAAALTAGSSSCVPGGEVSIPLQIDDAADLLAADITLVYDPNVLTAVGASVSGLGTGSELARTVRWGRMTISLARAEALKTGSGTLVVATLRAHDDAPLGTTSVSVAAATAYGADRAPRPLDVVGSQGTVTVRAPGDSGGGGGGGGGSCFVDTLLR